MNAEAAAIWAGLEFRKPSLLRMLGPVTSEELAWRPPNGANPIGWQLWHIAEVEDNWVREVILGQAPVFPFGQSVRTASVEQYPDKDTLLAYLHEVRARSRERLAAMTERDYDRRIVDKDFGEVTVRDIWAGVVTSFAWHAGQTALTIRLLRGRGPYEGTGA